VVRYQVGSKPWSRKLPTVAVTRKCTISGTAGDDVIYGTTGPDVICGNGGADRIFGLDGDDIIFAGTSTDVSATSGRYKSLTVRTASSAGSTIDAGEGKDLVYGSSGSDTIVGGQGNDEIWGGGGNDLLKGGSGNDSVKGGAGEDVIEGGEGNDLIDGGENPDRLDGGPGVNECIYTPEDSVLPNCDSVAPVLVSASSPITVDTSGASQTVTVEATVSDDVAGTDSVFLWILGPGGQDIQNGGATLISGDAMSGTWSNSFTIPRYAQTGVWRVEAQLRDSAGNRRTISTATTITVSIS
jgi:hypothetical protein